MGIADAILAALQPLGPAGMGIALFLIFVLDAALFPALPEVWLSFVFFAAPTGISQTAWALALLLMAVGGEAVGNALLYAVVRYVFVRRGRWPRFLERLMRRWSQFLIVKDERIILVNRVAPVVPMVGMFIAVLGWDVRKSLAYVVLGAAVKYAALLTLFSVLFVAFDRELAQWVTLGAVLLVVAVSGMASLVYRRRLKGVSSARR